VFSYIYFSYCTTYFCRIIKPKLKSTENLSTKLYAYSTSKISHIAQTYQTISHYCELKNRVYIEIRNLAKFMLLRIYYGAAKIKY